MFVYLRSEDGLWTVGHYSRPGEFVPESDHDNREDAAERVAWLNGSRPRETVTTTTTTPAPDTSECECPHCRIRAITDRMAMLDRIYRLEAAVATDYENEADAHNPAAVEIVDELESRGGCPPLDVEGVAVKRLTSRVEAMERALEDALTNGALDSQAGPPWFSPLTEADRKRQEGGQG